jgi:hypothetical protein
LQRDYLGDDTVRGPASRQAKQAARISQLDPYVNTDERNFFTEQSRAEKAGASEREQEIPAASQE